MSMKGLIDRCFYDIQFNKIRSQLICDKDDLSKNCKSRDIIGEFSLNLYTPYQLEVSIDDNFQGMGLSTVLLRNFRQFFGKAKNGKYNVIGIQKDVEIKIILDENVLLAIDTDASINDKGQSWWEKIGMVVNRYSNSSSKRCIDIVGYEKIIRLKDLLITISKIEDDDSVCFKKSLYQDTNKRQKTTAHGGNKEKIKRKYKKNINGKDMTIYKKTGDKKEYIKIKGELKYLKYYINNKKMIIKNKLKE
jgi:hypothetical protein